MSANCGDLKTIYRFGEDMIDESQIDLSDDAISVPGFAQSVNLNMDNLYGDMT